VLQAADVVQIQQVFAHYGHLLDDRQWHRLGEVFTADAVADYSRGGTSRQLTGLDEIIRFLSTASASSAHHVSNVSVFSEDGTVRAVSKFFVPYTRTEHRPHRWYGGVYDDELRRTDAGWRIQRRRVIGQWQLTTDEGEVPEHRRTF
jgi:3-phenylpropionate/cinnamic acid dioxygenase small subunit